MNDWILIFFYRQGHSQKYMFIKQMFVGAKPGRVPGDPQGRRAGDGVQVPPHGEGGAGRRGDGVVGGRGRRARPAAGHRHEGTEVVRR